MPYKYAFVSHGIGKVLVTGCSTWNIISSSSHFCNIINNAKDAFNERELTERDIFITFYKEDSHINLEIEDNAGGIPDYVINDIFKPEVTTKEEGKGTGLGLAIVTEQARLIGATVSIDDAPGGGARFVVSLRDLPMWDEAGS